MPQISVPYAAARVHMQERDAFDQSRIDRLLSASSYQEALRALSEIGWTGVESGADAEAVASQHVQDACALVRRVTPHENATDCFLLHYDALNLKALLKARCLGQKAESLSDCGIFPVEPLAHAVAEHNYKKLPDVMRFALDTLEKTLAIRDDALAIDVSVDKAVFALIFEKLQHVKSPMIRDYFVARADMVNAITVLRLRRMGRDAAFLQDTLLTGGAIETSAWVSVFDKPEAAAKMLARYGRKVERAAMAAALDANKLPALEKAMDDALLAPFTAVRRDALRLEPIIGFLLGREREAAAVRLILAGKANGFSPEAIQERLRELYGG